MGTLCAPFAAMADGDRAHPGTFIKDSAVTTAIKTKLAAEHISSLTKIHVDTDNNGVVWLKGTVESQDQADKAVSIARDTEHVASVHSDLVITPKD
jgi:hyperosmotically inducible protein